MNFLKKVHNSAAMKRLKAKTDKLKRELKVIAREKKSTFKREASKLRRKKR